MHRHVFIERGTITGIIAYTRLECDVQLQLLSHTHVFSERDTIAGIIA